MNPSSRRRSLLPQPPGSLALALLFGSLALSLSRSLARLRFPPPPAPDQFAAVGTGSEAASEWRGKSKCAAVSGRGAEEAGLGWGRDLPGDGRK